MSIDGEYAEEAATAGCIGIITVGGGAKGGRILPFGGSEGALGTNPIAIGIPTGNERPFLIDFATSMIANGKTYVADSEKRDLPPGCVVDKHGNPTVKVAEYKEGGHLLAFHKHKGLPTRNRKSRNRQRRFRVTQRDIIALYNLSERIATDRKAISERY